MRNVIRAWICALLLAGCATSAPQPTTTTEPIAVTTTRSPKLTTTSKLPAKTTTTTKPKPKRTVTTAEPVYYSTCADAPGPLYSNDPGYRAELDRDHDGIACESS